jgi:metallo-beta-lactamase family protein
MEIKLSFFGAAQCVTGSKTLLETPDCKILIDCGLFQGLKELRLLNWEKPTFDAKNVDFVLLTHAHLDHTGFLPILIKNGFTGKILCSKPTMEAAEVILLDSAKIQEEDALLANEKGYSKHTPAKPLYGVEEAKSVFKHFETKDIDEWIQLKNNIKIKFNYNGHIIGSTFIEIDIEGKIFVFSGDLGRENDLILKDPVKPVKANYLFVESTYGGRVHPDNCKESLIHIVNKGLKKGGTILIPSFAVERAQLVMYLLSLLKITGEIPDIPIYMDSPMANNVMEIFHNNSEWHKLEEKDYEIMKKNVFNISSLKQTLKLLKDTSTKIIIAGSGMASGGRILSYFEHYLENPKATIVLVGYQAEGTRGRDLLEGAKEIKLHGRYFTVKAKIENIQGLSAHADQNEIINWLKNLENKPEKTFIIHGEKDSSKALSEKLSSLLSYECYIPSLNEELILNI